MSQGPAKPPARGGGTRYSVSGARGGSSGQPRYLQIGGKYDPAPVRETTRRQLALILALLVTVVALMLVVFTAIDWLTSSQAKDLAASVLSPIVAVTGTALGFYFGGRGSS